MNSLLIIRGGAIGDFILTLPSIHLFKERHPGTRIEILGYPHIASLISQRFYGDATRSLDHRSMAGFFSKGELDKSLSEYFSSFDCVVSFLYDPDELFLNNLKKAGARKIITADGRPSSKMHSSDYLAQWLSEIGIPPKIQPPRLYPSKEDQAGATQILGNLKSPIAIHPGSGSPTKNWPLSNFIQLIEWLKSSGLDPVVISGPADSEVQTTFWQHPASKNCLRCHHPSLPTLAALLQKCRAFVGHDSGITHLAAAVDTPTLAIFGPTDPQIWAPRGKSVTVLKKGSSPSSVIFEDVKAALEIHLR